MIEIRLEYGGMRATNTRSSFQEAMAEARRMLNAHQILGVTWQDVSNSQHLAKAKGYSHIGGDAAFLYMFDNEPAHT